jgi:hypothetical protein
MDVAIYTVNDSTQHAKIVVKSCGEFSISTSEVQISGRYGFGSGQRGHGGSY